MHLAKPTTMGHAAGPHGTTVGEVHKKVTARKSISRTAVLVLLPAMVTGVIIALLTVMRFSAPVTVITVLVVATALTLILLTLVGRWTARE